MKAKLAVVALLFLSIGLGVALFLIYQVNEKQRTKADTYIEELKAEREKIRASLDEQKKVNYTLESAVSNRLEETKSLSLNLTNVVTNLTVTASNLVETKANLVEAKTKLAVTESRLAKVETEAKTTEAALTATKNALTALEKAKQEEIAQRDAKLAQLETNKDELSKQVSTLNGTLAKLNSQILETERRLTVSEGDREFLLKELKRLQAEKANLERQLNDLEFLREQINHLKAELSIAKRLDWIRRGLLGGETKKAGQLLVDGFHRSGTNAVPRLDVELRRDGTATPAPAPPK